MEPTNGIKTWQWVVTVIVIIVLVILGYSLFKGAPADTDVTPTDTNEPVTINSNELNRIVVADQFPGNIVYISSVQLAKPGFVVVKKDNNGTPGDVIGFQYFDKGINPGRITTTSATVEGGIYYAQLYVDDGDKKFDATKDATVKDSAGKDIMRLFRVSTTVTELKG
jgi:hypothetical protein